MKKVKKLVALLMVMIMSLSLAACGSSGSAGGSSDEPITLTCYSQTANYSGELGGWFAQVLLDKFNVKINVVPDTDGVYDTRMEAGDLGDIVIWGSDGDKYIQAVNAGLLYDWEEDDLLTDYGSYIQANMPYALEKNKNLNPDGKLHGFGHNVATSSEDHQDFFYTWDIRWDLYKQLGYPAISNLDDYVAMLEQMKAICPTDDNGKETYAVSLWPDWDENMVMYVKAMATAYYGYDEMGIGLYNCENGEFYGCLDKGGPYLTCLKFFNTLYQKGLLDPDSMTQTYDEMIAKVQNGGTFFSIFNYSGSLGYNTEAHIAENKMMETLLPSDATPIVYGMNVLGGNRIWSIGAKTQYPELCMEIINWMSTPEGRMVSEYGPQGLTWDYDENGNTYFTDLGKTTNKNREYEMTETEAGKYAGNFNDGANQMNNVTWAIDADNPDSNGETYNSKNWKSEQVDALCATEQDWRDVTGFNTVQEYLNSKSYVVAPGTSYSESVKSDELKVVWAQVIESICNDSWQAIYAKTDADFDKVVADMTTKANEYGYADCVTWSQNEASIRHALEVAVTTAK